MKSVLLILLWSQLYAETIHSSLLSYIEHKEFKNSVQKEAGDIYGFGTDIHSGYSAYKFIYEYGYTNTKQPPLKEDLQTSKLFLQYSYDLQNDLKFNMNYIQILYDNIAITNGGQAYGLGLTYQPEKNICTNFTQYYTHYHDFNVYQSDGTVEYKMNMNGFRIKFSSILKYIHIEEKNINSFTKNAKDDYLTSGLKLHIHYSDYHFGSAVFLGKRAFAVMDNGFKIQHHAMEFDRTYAVGIGKDISDFVLRFQYIYSRAKELPANNANVEISNIRVLLNYKF